MTKTNDSDFIYKYVVIGEAGVGKTSLVRQFIYNEYHDNYNTTIGVDFSCKHLLIEDKKIRVQIWDTAGQEAFRSIIQSYYKNTVGVIIVIDSWKKEEIKNIEYWRKEYFKKQHDEIPNTNIFFMVVVNKIDTFKGEQNYNMINDYCNDNNIMFYGTSAKTGSNVNECFKQFTSYIYQETKDRPGKLAGIKNNTVDFESPKPFRYMCCCIV